MPGWPRIKLASRRISLIVDSGGVGLRKMENLRVFVCSRVIRKYLSFAALGLVTALGVGCAGSQEPRGALQAAAEPIEAPPVQTPDQVKDRIEARQAYVTCLKQAAQYASTRAAGTADEASLIAPMCYPQFLNFEIASAAGMGSHARHVFDRDGDKRQLDFAADAIRQERGLAALTPGNQ